MPKQPKKGHRARSLKSAPVARPADPPNGPPRPSPTRLMGVDSQVRKQFPLTTGLLDYFPDACCAVAEVSYQGNQKHNPGQPMHHARGKSRDHADCIGRHLLERGGFDSGIRHSAALAWRALALLQEELEAEGLCTLPRGAKL
jgi:dATP/dGTP diphosphohydrolase